MLVPPDKITEEDYEYFQYVEKEKEERERKAREKEKERIEKFKERRQEIVWNSINKNEPDILNDSDGYEVPSKVPIVKSGPRLRQNKNNIIKPGKRIHQEDSDEDDEVAKKIPNKESEKSAIEKLCGYESSDDD